jgi:hypothetical protein
MYSCSISYAFNGASIDYTRTKTIAIADFSNNAEYVYPPLSQNFTEKLRDTYTRQTRLQLLKSEGDLNLEGEITSFTFTPMSIAADSYASETKLTMTMRVRFSNKANPEDDYEKQYTAFQTFNSDRTIEEVQEELTTIMITEICDNIFNDTVAKW